LGDRAADDLRRDHDSVLAGVVAIHRGPVVKGAGDGILVAFDSVSDGVAAAVALQHAIHELGRQHRIRLGMHVGLSAGDVSWEDGDCFGLPAVEAALLGAAAGTGEILCAEIARALARGRSGVEFGPTSFPSEGLIEPVTVDEVAWSPTAALTGSAERRGRGRPPYAASVRVDEASVLHTLRVRGFVGPEGFVASIGEHPVEILDSLMASGHVLCIEPAGLYRLQPSARSLQEALLETYADEHVRELLAEPYERLNPLNMEMKQLCGAWQVRYTSLNDHADHVYDRDCLDRLIRIAAAARPVIEAVAAAVPRMGRYVARLDDAVDAVTGGSHERFTGVMCESVHDIWMELHEDLLVLLRKDRAEEGGF
jgi:class 3 adenylate cyclase